MLRSKAYPIPLVHYLLARLMKILATTLLIPLDTNFELVLLLSIYSKILLKRFNILTIDRLPKILDCVSRYFSRVVIRIALKNLHHLT